MDTPAARAPGEPFDTCATSLPCRARSRVTGSRDLLCPVERHRPPALTHRPLGGLDDLDHAHARRAVGQGPFAGPDAVQEVQGLAPQPLRVVQVRDPDVAVAVADALPVVLLAVPR